MENELTYATLREHAGHDLTIWTRYAEVAGIECRECHTDIVTLKNEDGCDHLVTTPTDGSGVTERCDDCGDEFMRVRFI